MLVTETGWPCSQRLSPLLQWAARPVRIRCLTISQVILPTDSKALSLAPFLIIWYLCSFKMSHLDLLHPGSFPGHSRATDTSGDPTPVSAQLSAGMKVGVYLLHSVLSASNRVSVHLPKKKMEEETQGGGNEKCRCLESKRSSAQTDPGSSEE